MQMLFTMGRQITHLIIGLDIEHLLWFSDSVFFLKEKNIWLQIKWNNLKMHSVCLWCSKQYEK